MKNNIISLILIVLAIFLSNCLIYCDDLNNNSEICWVNANNQIPTHLIQNIPLIHQSFTSCSNYLIEVDIFGCLVENQIAIDEEKNSNTNFRSISRKNFI